MMLKRSYDSTHEELPVKRVRLTNVDRFATLSDELILRIFSYLAVSDLILCHRLADADLLMLDHADHKDSLES